MSLHRSKALFVLVGVVLVGCGGDSPTGTEPPEAPPVIPVVVHVLHKGEPVGTGYNLPAARILRQIEILNEDFRRKEGTRGHNTHADGADTGIEFTLARSDPKGSPTNGIHRVDITTIANPIPENDQFRHYAHYGYWDHRHYMNVWILPYPEATKDLFLGRATGPDTDLPGHQLLLEGEPSQPEGVHINFFHFGETGGAGNHELGRSLTHEVGHYLGVLHPWGDGDCATNDYCDDTPPVTAAQSSCPSTPPQACDGSGPTQVTNYMDYVPDDCMNLFTNDQAARMQYVLENSAARKSLLSSPGLRDP